MTNAMTKPVMMETKQARELIFFLNGIEIGSMSPYSSIAEIKQRKDRLAVSFFVDAEEIETKIK
jgi:hypothetical protein